MAMSKDEYHEVCRQLNLSPSYGAAKALGVAQSTACRYANGAPIPETVARLLRCYVVLDRYGVWEAIRHESRAE